MAIIEQTTATFVAQQNEDLSLRGLPELKYEIRDNGSNFCRVHVMFTRDPFERRKQEPNIEIPIHIGCHHVGHIYTNKEVRQVIGEGGSLSQYIEGLEKLMTCYKIVALLKSLNCCGVSIEIDESQLDKYFTKNIYVLDFQTEKGIIRTELTSKMTLVLLDTLYEKDFELEDFNAADYLEPFIGL